MRLKSYIFVASDQSLQVVSTSLAEMEASWVTYAHVVLESDEQLRLLLDLLGLKRVKEIPLKPDGDFVAAFDFSDDLLPELDKENFDAFFNEWVRTSMREATMDEYGQLVFLQGAASDWNCRRNRFVLAERA